MNEERIVEKLRKILALTTSPVEGEAQAAAEHLQRLLTAYNLSIADLEQRGAGKPQMKQLGHDLGKAAFTWKLNLAEAIAAHYFCWPIVDRRAKTVAFVGRPDNVESLTMLYAWVIDQIKRLSSESRRHHNEQVSKDEHVDPLRWQVNFGLGVVQRLRIRLDEIKTAQVADDETTALVLHHQSEIMDWFEEKFGMRPDGSMTKKQREAHERWRKEEEELQQLKVTDPEAFYQRRPWERPETIAKNDAEWQKRMEARRKKDERNARRRQANGGPKYRQISAETERKEEQAYQARQSGRANADKVNLQPFIEGAGSKKEVR